MRGRLLVLSLAVSLVLAGCGGDEGDAASWASSVCGDVSEWVGEVDSAVQSLTEGGFDLDEADLRDATDRVGEATNELTSDLEDLGPPEIDAAQQAQAELRRLLDELREQYDAAVSALQAGLEPLQMVARIANALSAAASQLQRTFDNLQGLDPGGELADAFRSSDECVALREQIAEIGS
jgi:hypothetical protein